MEAAGSIRGRHCQQFFRDIRICPVHRAQAMQLWSRRDEQREDIFHCLNNKPSGRDAPHIPLYRSRDLESAKRHGGIKFRLLKTRHELLRFNFGAAAVRRTLLTATVGYHKSNLPEQQQLLGNDELNDHVHMTHMLKDITPIAHEVIPFHCLA